MLDVSSLRTSAAERGGFFTLTDAAAAGCTSHGVRRRLASREWLRLEPGVFVAADWYGSLSREARHLVDLRARLHVVDSGWCAARRSAALVHGVQLLGRPAPQPQLVRDRPRAPTRGSSRFERFNTLPESERAVVAGTAVTTLERTVVDLAREESFTSALVAADSALRAGASLEVMGEIADRCSAWPRAPRVRPVLHHADGRAESPLESLSRAGFLRLGLPMPEIQTEIWQAGRHVARVDFLWREANVIGEADGRSKYRTVEDLYAEKRREERLRDLGFEVVRWDWTAALHPERGLGPALLRAFARGRHNQLAPGVALRLARGPFAA